MAYIPTAAMLRTEYDVFVLSTLFSPVCASLHEDGLSLMPRAVIMKWRLCKTINLLFYLFPSQSDKDKIFVIIEETLSEGPHFKEDYDHSSVPVDVESPPPSQKRSPATPSSSSSSSRPSVIRSPVKRDGS